MQLNCFVEVPLAILQAGVSHQCVEILPIEAQCLPVTLFRFSELARLLRHPSHGHVKLWTRLPAA